MSKKKEKHPSSTKPMSLTAFQNKKEIDMQKLLEEVKRRDLEAKKSLERRNLEVKKSIERGDLKVKESVERGGLEVKESVERTRLFELFKTEKKQIQKTGFDLCGKALDTQTPSSETPAAVAKTEETATGTGYLPTCSVC